MSRLGFFETLRYSSIFYKENILYLRKMAYILLNNELNCCLRTLQNARSQLNEGIVLMFDLYTHFDRHFEDDNLRRAYKKN